MNRKDLLYRILLVIAIVLTLALVFGSLTYAAVLLIKAGGVWVGICLIYIPLILKELLTEKEI